MAIEGGDGSTLSLDFTTMGGVLDPRLTFSRASTATFVNSSGYVEWAGANLFRSSNDLSGTNWTKQNLITPSAPSGIPAPGGSTTDITTVIPDTTNTQDHRIIQSLVLSSGLPYTISFYVKPNGYNFFYLFDNAAASPYALTFNLTTNTSISFSGGSNLVIGTPDAAGWRKISFSFVQQTASTSNTFIIRVHPDSNFNSFAGNGTSGILVWGFQINPGSTAQTYYPTTTAAYYAPRFDYSPTNIGEPRGLLIEGSAINYTLNSSSLSNYVASSMTAVTAGSEPNPEGTANSAAQIYATAGPFDYHGWYKDIVAGTNTQITVSIWAKARNYTHLFLSEAANGRSAVRFNLSTGATDNNFGLGFVSAKTTAFRNGWWRCEMVVNVTASASYYWTFAGVPSGATLSEYAAQYAGTGNAADGIYCYGFQVEAGSGASSYIPTGASQVTRNGDDCYMSGTNFSSWWNQSEGTAFIETVGMTKPTDLTYRAFTITQFGEIGYQIGATWIYDNSGFRITELASSATKHAVALKANDFAISNGETTIRTGTGAFGTTYNRLQLGSYESQTQYMNGCIKRFKYYPTRLPNAQLQQITQPTYVAPTLDLDFRSGVLDSRFTHTRGSNATFVNSLGYVDWAGSNVILFSETLEIGVGKWTQVGTAGVSIDPDVLTPNGNPGTAKVTGTTVGSHRVVSNAIQMNRQRHTLTMWLRGGTSLMTNIGVYDGTNWCPFVATIVSGPGTITFNALQVIISGLTTAWTKIQIVLSPVTDSAFNVLIYPDNNGTSKDVYIWGVQINPGSTAQTYYPTTTTAYYGPRFDYSSTKIGQANGLLIESQSINYLTYSNSFTVSAGWNVVSNLNTTAWTGFTAPDQSTNAVRLVANGTNGSHRIEHIDISGLSNNTQYTVSVWCKPDGYPRLGITTSNSNARRNFDPASNASTGYGTSSTGSIVEFPGGWYRCSMTFTTGAANTPFGVWLSVHKDDEDTITSWVGNNMGGIQVWGVQVEAGSGATSYIPTGATAGGVTRTADNCYMSGISSWFNASQGTFITNCTYNSSAGDNNGIEISVGTGSSASNRIGIRKGYVDYYSGGGSAQAEMYPTVTSGTVRIGTAYLVNDFAMCSNGGTMRADGSGAVPVGLNTLKLYADSGSITLSGTLQSFTYYPIRLSNNQLLSLTTL
jgi:hypothetical protein